MQQQVEQLLAHTQKTIHAAKNLAELEQIRTQILGKKGQLTDLLKQLGALPPEQRSQLGQIVNSAKQQLLDNLQQRIEMLNQQELAAKLQRECVDVTLP